MNNAPQVSQIAVLPSPSPTGHLSDPRTIPEAHGLSPLRPASPPTSDSTLPEADPPMVASRSGHRSLTPTNHTPGPETATMPPPIVENPSTRGHIDDPLISRGAIRVRLAWAKRLENKLHRINAAKKQYLAVDHWPTLRPPSLPNPTQVRAYIPPLPGSLHSFGWRPDLNYNIRHDQPVRSGYTFEYSPLTLT